MKILLTGATGGIGLAILHRLNPQKHKFVCVAHADIETNEEFDWMICAHGVLDETDVYETFHANVISNIYLAEEIKAKNIIFISSTSGVKGNDKYPVYSASKAALNMYAKLKGYYVICPGPTDTPMFKKLGITDIKPQSPDEVAKVVEKIINGEIKSKLIIIRNGEINYG